MLVVYIKILTWLSVGQVHILPRSSLTSLCQDLSVFSAGGLWLETAEAGCTLLAPNQKLMRGNFIHNKEFQSRNNLKSNYTSKTRSPNPFS